jgi:hypothetical protein
MAKRISKKQKELKRVSRQLILLRILMLVCIAFLFYLSHKLTYYKTSQEKELEENPRYQGIIDACREETLFESATCLNQITKTFIKYNISNANKKLTFQELYEEGGVCKNWAEYYCSICKEYGYFASIIEFPTGVYNVELTNGKNITYEISHTFCICSKTGEGYVILDQNSLDKFQFDGEPDLAELEENFKNQTAVR